MNLKLTRPLAFLDIEATGTNICSDRIVEISVLKIFPNENRELKTKRVNPTIPIPKEASLIHGIYDEDVKDLPTFNQIAKSLAQFIADADLAGYNSNRFDIPLLMEEFLRADVEFNIKNKKFVDVQNIFHQMEQRTLKAALKFYCNKNHEKAHSAEADVLATHEILEAQLQRYQQLEKDTAFLHDFSSKNTNADLAGRIIYNEQGVEVFNFGKHKGKSVEEVLKIEPSYYAWMMNGDFPLYTKKVLTAIKLRGFNK